MQQKKNTILTTSTANGRAAHTIPTLMKRITVLLALILSFALGARAADYVIYQNGYFLAINNNNNGIQAIQNFNPSTCVWTGPNNSSSGYLQITRNNKTYYLNRGNSGLSVSNNANTTWNVSGNTLYTVVENYMWETNYYLYYSTRGGYGSTAGWSTTYSSNNVDVLYQYKSESISASNGEKTYIVSLESVTADPAAIDYNKSAEVTANGGNVTITTTTTPAHTKYTLTPNSGNGDPLIYFSQDGNTTDTKSPVSTTTTTNTPTNYTWSLSSTSNASLGNTTTTTESNTVTYNNSSSTDKQVTVTVKATYTVGGTTHESEAKSTTITLNRLRENPTKIEAEDLTLAVDEQKAISYTLTPTDAHDDVRFVIANTEIATVDENGVVTAKKAGITTATVTAYKSDGSTSAALTTTCNVSVTPKAPTIEFSLGTGITATITTSEADAKIYYTTNGDTPTTSSTQYTGPFNVEAGATVKAIVVVTVNSEQLVSPVAESLANAGSGIIGNTVYLYDLEDHNWTYYSGVNTSVDGGNYNNNYAGKLYSPNPRNVKITYNANGGTVSIDESETSFVYFKTLEQGATAGQYPYTVISNPFSKRPTGKGFGGWKIISGGEYINGYNNGNTLPLDQEITFVNLPYPSTNCISAEIKLEATWVDLNNIVRRTNTGDYTYSATGGTYETNILVLKSNHTGTITVNSPCTIMMVEPDGTDNFRDDYTFSGYIVPMANGNTKIEFARWRPGNDGINPRGRNFTIGRGMVMDGTRRTIYGTNSNLNINQVLKIESGTYSTFYAIGSSGPSDNMTKQQIILGNDYDRVNNGGDNSKLSITNNMYLLGKEATIGTDKLKIIAKSGKFTPDLDHSTAQASGNCFYLWFNSGDGSGTRELVIEGGEFWHIAGGWDSGNSNNSVNLKIRMKGGTIHGSVYGGAARYDTKGYKQFIFTGGTVEGWIAGGSNGYLAEGASNQNGTVTGRSYVYVGGRTQVSSDNSTTAIDMSVGGNVYGAGCGNTTLNNSGRVTEQTNVVIADECYVQRGVYGGGAYGSSPGTANVYITGNAHVGGVYENTFDVYGGVYGGARAKGGGSTNIYMTGGYVEHGVYGGSNLTGTINNNVTMQINGGQVGTSSQTANIHGGGYGKDTKVNGDVTLTLGANTTDPGVTVYGDVYGGSALGTVNDASSDKTEVTLNCGTINGSLYGGGLGDATEAANVYGAVTVTVNGGSVKKTSVEGSGGVYGANNIKGAPQSSVTVDIYGTDPAPATDQYALYSVYGGGNRAPYDGTPEVTVHGCDNSIEYVYGGGNAASVAATDVTIWGGNVIGNVFGGGNGTVSAADVIGDANTTIHGGRILNVYGGSNSEGNIGGTIKLNIYSQAEPDKDLCNMNIDNVYGGGNLADMAGNINVTLGCVNYLKELYGGASNADVGSDINMTITSGHFDRVFGGNNLGGAIKGSITVNVEETGCNPITIGEIYGGGNKAAYSVYGYNDDGSYKETGTQLYSDPVVNIRSFTSIGRMFGGGLGEEAVIVGSPTVNINEVVGDKANNTTWPHLNKTINFDDGTEVTLPSHEEGKIGAIGTVFGGGNAAKVIGNTNVNIGTADNIVGVDIRGNVYGGGNQADVTGKTNVKVGRK